MFYDATRKVVVYDEPEAQQALSCVPGARAIDAKHIGVPFDLYNMQLCRYIGLPVVPPMMGYDWPMPPGMSKPWNAQVITANFLCVHPRDFCLSDMGTGKTLAHLWAADFVMQQFPPGMCRAIIAAPLSTLKRVWGNALFKAFLGRRTFVIVYGDQAKRRKLLAQPADFYIINHDGVGLGAKIVKKNNRNMVVLDGLAKDIADRQDIRIVIFDEFTACKDHTTKRHYIYRAVLQPKDYFWPLSGSPTPQGPTDAYGPAKLVNNAFGESFNSFQDRVTYKISQFKRLARKGSQVEVRKLLSPSVRFKVEECTDIPPCTPQQRDAELSPEQVKAYREMKHNCQIIINAGYPITVANEGALRWKLIQIACGVIYGMEGTERREHQINCEPRIKVLHEVIEETTHKGIIFAPLTSVVRMLYGKLKGHRKIGMVYGDTPIKERDRIFAGFQDGDDFDWIVAHPGCMAHGLDLYAASTTAWFAPIDKTETYLQAIKRMDRPGQVNRMTNVQISATPIEREIYRRIENNETMQGLVMQLIRGDNYDEYTR